MDALRPTDKVPQEILDKAGITDRDIKNFLALHRQGGPIIDPDVWLYATINAEKERERAMMARVDRERAQQEAGS
jgi:hypothetical protein